MNSPACVIFDHLMKYAAENATDFSLDSDQKYNAVLQMNIHDYDVDLNVKILEVDATKHYVQVTKGKGHKFAFHEAYKHFKNFFNIKSLTREISEEAIEADEY